MFFLFTHVVVFLKIFISLLVGGSLLLGTHSPDISIDMDSVQRDQGQMQLLQEQVWGVVIKNGSGHGVE